MAIKLKRINKDGRRTYEFSHRIYLEKDPETGKRNRKDFYTTYTEDKAYSPSLSKTNAERAHGKWVSDCNEGRFQSRRDQKEQLIQEILQTEKNKLEYVNNPTLADYVMNQYIPERSAELKCGTIENNIRPSIKMLIGRVGSLKMADITDSMMKKIVIDHFTKSGLAYSSCDNHYIVWKCMFDRAVEDGIIKESPMKDVKKPRKPKPEYLDDDHKSLTMDQYNRLQEAIENEPLKWKAMIYFMLDTGCRRGEVAGMKYEHIDLNTGLVWVCNNVQSSVERGLYETTPKNGKPRKFYLNEFPLSLMCELKNEQMTNLLNNGVANTVYCFEGQNGGPINPKTISNHFRNLGKKCGIDNFHPHMLRHTMTTFSLSNGADITTISRKLGHSNVSTTLNMYSHATQEAQRRNNEILANILYVGKPETAISE